MTVRRRLCRAFDCPRHIDRRILFCNVHWHQLPPKLQAPIQRNSEAPAGATVNGVRAVATGVRAAVAYLARKEGKSRSLETAVKANAVAPGSAGEDTSGGAAAAIGGGTGAGSSGSTRFISKV